jgi:hypothetical protein
MLLGAPGLTFKEPERDPDPYETINQLLVKHRGRGVGKKSAGKIKLVTRMLDCGFDLAGAADHSNCPSAAYFLKRLTAIAATASASTKVS